MMEDSEAELTVAESDALGADFITVEMDTQPIEYVVKWAEVGSKFTIACLKKESEEAGDLSSEQLKVEGDEHFFVPYEEVYPCEVTEQSVEITMDSEEEEEEEEDQGEALLEAGDVQLDGEDESDQDDSDLAHLELDERQYRCSYCGKCYSHASSLYRHQQTHAAHGGVHPPATKRALDDALKETGHTCPHCGMSFKGSRMLGSHLRLHGQRRIHPCNICGKEFNHSSSLSRHRLIHKKGQGLMKDSVSRPTVAMLHYSLKSDDKKKRTKGRQVSTAAHLSAAGDKFYACPQCDMSFRTSTQLSKHQVTHVKQLLDNYTPDKENLAQSSSDLKIRLKLCSRDKPNFYTLCKRKRRCRRGGKSPAQEEEEEEPEEEPEEEEDEEEEAEDEEESGSLMVGHGCSHCGKWFSHASSLARHQHSHQGLGGRRPLATGSKSRTYTCSTCNKTFMHSSSFSRHKKAHLQDPAKSRKRAELDETAPLETDSE
ncbi:zinc finger protein 594 [Synchiropus splendidus]|uniref:zinc finger protein 594 n=1 Tax=Synchiropus splendidus TaxID=270530 RepID=UPI00237E4EBF|nr:zinc finger protein 594 [Synchiropus splendidus]XP_053731641.1 zinc finger protein 594 [Synchiropus splendidus]